MVRNSWKSGAFALGLIALLAGTAEAQKGDAARAADFTARSSVQTIYKNLIAASYEWPYIRDEKMPEILVRSVDAIEAQAGSYEPRLILGTFIPTYMSSFYDEIDKINAEHKAECIEVGFLEMTFVPFIQACSKGFGGQFSPSQIFDGIVQTRFSFKVCGGSSGCAKRLSSKYSSTFKKDLKPEKEFSSVCGGS